MNAQTNLQETLQTTSCETQYPLSGIYFFQASSAQEVGTASEAQFSGPVQRTPNSH